MEYYCHYCMEWYDPAYCESHFESIHGQKGVTFENLKERLSHLGGLSTREEAPVEDFEKDERRVFVTNNFRHYL